jgi:PKD repeat protein
MKKHILLLAAVLLSLHLLSQHTTLVLRPGPEDAYCASIRTDAPYTNFATDSNFMANAWTYQGDFFVQRSLIKFDLSQIPENVEIISANLSLYCNKESGHHQMQSGENKAYLKKVISWWDNKKVTWNNQPDVISESCVILPRSVNQHQNYEAIDVTNLIMDMLPAASNNFGFMLHLEVEETYRCMVFASSWHYNPEWRPKLEIVYDDCELPVLAFDYVIEDSTVYFSSNSSNTNAWFWDFGDGQYSIEEHPVHAYSQMINQWVCLWSSNECGISHFCDSIFFCDEPSGIFDYYIDGKTIAFNDSCTHTNHVFWSFGDGYYSDLHNPVHIYRDSGVYIVELTMINDCMSRTISDTLTISITNQDELDENNGIFIFPNPSNGSFLIDFLVPQHIEIVNVYDSRGRLVKQYLVNNEIRVLDIDLRDCHSGVYYVRSQTEEGKTQIGRLVVIYDK